MMSNGEDHSHGTTGSYRPPAAAGRRLAWLLLAVLVAHLAVAWWSRDGLIRDDAVSYVLLGRHLAAGHGYVFEPGGVPTSWRAPGYPVLLAAVFWLTGGSLVAARVLHALLWTLAAGLAYLLARRAVGAKAALVAAALVGFYPEFLGFTGLLWSENLTIPLMLAALCALFAWATGWASLAGLLVTGGLIGATILTRSTALMLVPLVWALAACHRQSGRPVWGEALVISAVALAMTGGWTLRNWALHGHPILVESNAGFNLYLGNSPDTPVPFAWRKAKRLDRDAYYQSLTQGRSEGERYAALSRAALAQMKAQPLRTLVLAAGKTFDFWLPDFFVARNVNAGSFGPAYRAYWKPVAFLTAGAFLLVAALGLAYGFRTRQRWETRVLLLLLALYTLPHALVFGASRHHLPLMPVLMILAAPEAQRLWTLLAQRLRGEAQQQAPLRRRRPARA